MNNEFIGNICVGRCEMQGHTGKEGEKAVIRDNYIDGELLSDQKYNKEFIGNKSIVSEVRSDGKLYVDKKVIIPKRKYSRTLRTYLNNRNSIKK